MAQYTHLPSKDYRRESWTLTGSGVTSLFSAWNNSDDTKYASCPAGKGRAAVTYPQNLSTSAIPSGATITSVTVYLRAAKTDAVARSITLNLLASDNTSLYTTRTIYLTQDIADYEISTYILDPLNKPWNITRLNRMITQLSVNGTVAGKVRVYSLYTVVNYHTAPSTTVVAPVGTQVTASPTLRWVYEQTDGDVQGKAEWKIFKAEEVQKATFNADTSTAQASGTTQGDQTQIQLPASLVRGAYYAYVRTHSIFGTKSSWGARQFQVIPQLPGAPIITATADNDSANIDLKVTNATNLMSLQQSGAEEGTDKPEYVTTNCALTRDLTTFYAEGAGSYRMTASSAATMSVISSYVPVAAQAEITFRAQFRAAATGRTINAELQFFDEVYTALGSPLTATGTDATGVWTELTATGTTPVDAFFMKLKLEIASPANAEIHNIDGIGLMYGPGTQWSTGGHFSRNLLTSDYSSHPTAADWSAATGTTLSNRTSGVTETGEDGPNAMRMTVASISTSIAYVATGTAFSDATVGNSFTLNKPGGSTATGHFMIAFLSASYSGAITAPAGWTVVNGTPDEDPDVKTGLWILTKFVEAGDPATWTASLDTSTGARRCVVISYSGVDTTSPVIEENVKTYAGSPFTVTTQSLQNPDPNAWNVSAFTGRNSASGSWSGGTTGQPGTTENISYVGASATWCGISSKTSYKINRPTGVKSGDLMIATTGMWGNVSTVTPPSGWTLKRKTVSGGTFPTTLCVFTRTAGGSEPASWTGTTSHTAAATRVTTCVAYRGAANSTLQFTADQANASNGHFDDNRKVTGTTTNNNGRSWRISAFAANAADRGIWRDSNETIRRATGSIEFVTGNNAMTVSVFDSNGVVGTGAHKRQAYWYNTAYPNDRRAVKKYYATAVGWTGIITATTSAPPAGTGQTERSDGNTGSGGEQIATAIYDSNGPIDVGSTAITALYASGTSPAQAFASWAGVLRPAVPSTSGAVKATMTQRVNVESIAESVLTQAENKVTMTASFLGSVPGEAYLTLNFYEANRLLNTYTGAASAFTTDIWMPAYMTVPLPDGTTHIEGAVESRALTVADTVDVDKVGVMLGERTYWRPGTNEPIVHSVWSHPVIEYADDDGLGYGEWKTLHGQVAHPPIYDPLSGSVMYTDYMPIPATPRKYRALTLSHGLQGDQFKSEWSEESSDTVHPFSWWIKDPTDPTNNMAIRVKAEAVGVELTNTATVFQTLGSEFPIVLTEGYKSDSFSIVVFAYHDEWVALRRLIRLNRTLFVQSNTDNAWWVRAVEQLASSTIVYSDTRLNPLREVTLQFIQVEPEE